MSDIADLYPVADTEASVIVSLKTTDKNAMIVQGIVKTNETQKQHYTKIRDRWSNAEKIVVNTLVVTTTLIGIVCIILPAINVQDNTLYIILGTTGTVTGILTAILQTLFIKRKQTFSLTIALYNKKIDQAYVLWQKSIVNGTITDDELTQFNAINNQTTLNSDEQQQELTNVSTEDAKVSPLINALEDLKGIILSNIDKVKSISQTALVPSGTSSTA